ncbi:MAG: ribonuclease III [Thermodesulfovibrionales bacterium]|nr:ribonuclease III [Thermodesulfovibrionales bacterium]
MHALYSKNIEEIEVHLGYSFNNKKLLIEAITHKSYVHEHPTDSFNYNERLEFLGDAVLGLVVSHLLFSHSEDLTDAIMSKKKSFLVNKSTLYEIASKISLGKYLRLGKGEERSGGRQKKSVIADAMEAIIGAIFLDSDYDTVKQIIQRLYDNKLSDAINQQEGYDFKSELQEKVQKIFNVLPEYRIIKQDGQEHQRVFTVEVLVKDITFGVAKGKSKKEAQMLAAKQALEKL